MELGIIFYRGFESLFLRTASYAVESFQSLFLKTYYPKEFKVAILTSKIEL